ncbi:MAG: hypothetical protein ACK42H_18890 [Planctomycetota bacterium]|jgi:hypothetical protein
MGGVLGGFSSPKIFWGERNIFFLNLEMASIEKLLAIHEKGVFYEYLSNWTFSRRHTAVSYGFESAVSKQHKVAGTLRCAVSQGTMCISLNTADGTWNVPSTMSLQSTPWATTLDQAPMSAFISGSRKRTANRSRASGFGRVGRVE